LTKVLIIEDEPNMVLGLKDSCEYEGYEVAVARDGKEGVEKATTEKPDIILLDVMLPLMSGLDVCRTLRRRGIETPILMLTAKAGEADKVVGLEMGADDYLSKPFSPREMVARVRAILRRTDSSAAAAETAPSYHKGTLKIDYRTYEVFARGQQIRLTLKEFELLRFLVQNSNRVLSRDQLLDRVWGGETFVTPRTVDVHIRRLRKAVEEDDRRPRLILTLRGVGYKFDEKALAE